MYISICTLPLPPPFLHQICGGLLVLTSERDPLKLIAHLSIFIYIYIYLYICIDIYILLYISASGLRRAPRPHFRARSPQAHRVSIYIYLYLSICLSIYRVNPISISICTPLSFIRSAADSSSSLPSAIPSSSSRIYLYLSISIYL